MKKFTAIMMAAVMVLSLTACSSSTESEAPASGDSAVTSEANTSTAAPETGSAPETDAAPETAEPSTTTTPAATSGDTDPKETADEENVTSETAPEETTPEVTTPAETTPATTTAGTTATTPATTPAKPATTKPENTTPATTKPVTTKPVTTKPVTTTTVPETEPEESVEEPEEKPSETLGEPTDILNSIYNLFGEDERFPATGGDFSSGELIEGAGAFSLSDPVALDSVTGFPEAHIGSIDSAATLMHMMNANTFTSGAFHVVDGTDINALNTAVRDNIQSRMWCCGFPERLIVVNAGDYLICAFGKNFAIDAFKTHLLEQIPTAVIAIEEEIL